MATPRVKRTFPAPSPLVALLEAAERIGWQSGAGPEAGLAELRPAAGSGGEAVGAGRPVGCGEDVVEGELGSRKRGSAFEIVDQRWRRRVLCPVIQDTPLPSAAVPAAGADGGAPAVRSPLWQQVGKSWYADEWAGEKSAEKRAEKMDITFLLEGRGEPTQEHLLRENKRLKANMKILEAMAMMAEALRSS